MTPISQRVLKECVVLCHWRVEQLVNVVERQKSLVFIAVVVRRRCIIVMLYRAIQQVTPQQRFDHQTY